MPTAIEWVAILDPTKHWRDRSRSVADAILLALADVPETEAISTRMLAERLWPEETARGPVMIPARIKLLPKAITLAARELTDCWFKGEPYKWMGTVAYPKLWHAPKVTRREPCPHCAGTGIEPQLDPELQSPKE